MGIENKLDIVKEKVSTKFIDCPIIVLGVKELPKNSAIEIAIESLPKDSLELIELKSFNIINKSIEFNNLQVDISHQKLLIHNKIQIDVIKIAFNTEAEIDYLFYERYNMLFKRRKWAWCQLCQRY